MSDLFANFMELWGAAYFGDLSKYMYKGGFYSAVFLFALLVPLIVWFFYYKVVDNIMLAKRSVWCIILSVVLLVCGIFAYVFSYNSITDYLFRMHIEKYNISSYDVLCLASIAVLWSFVFSVLYSWILKNLSVKSRNIPF